MIFERLLRAYYAHHKAFNRDPEGFALTHDDLSALRMRIDTLGALCTYLDSTSAGPRRTFLGVPVYNAAPVSIMIQTDRARVPL